MPSTSFGSPVRSKTNAFIDAVLWLSWCSTHGRTERRPRDERAPLALRFGCLRVVPHVVGHLAGVQGEKPIPQYLESRKRPVRDSALEQQPVLVVDQKLQALDLASFDGALPSEKSRAGVDLAFVDVRTRIVAALRRH